MIASIQTTHFEIYPTAIFWAVKDLLCPESVHYFQTRKEALHFAQTH